MNTIITIGRQFGSGGHEIGCKLAEHFNIKCYDKELLTRAAKESGMCEEVLEHQDERPTGSFLYNLVLDTYSFGYNTASTYFDMPVSHRVFLAQFDTIKKIAEDGPCVIVGRCADYALQERKDVLNIFIYAEKEERIKRVMGRFKDITSEDKAWDMISKKDKQRKSYYDYYSSKKWGHVDTYDLSVDSSVLGIEGTVKLIIQFIEDFESKAK
ncbi:MAG: cytidylate kinase-like family protein [Lachnospiraceae bacterium]|nr:cytidylate kinase-like family protein [Lachnospiraceae bacterium]